jgi:transposase InsO family protein
VRKFKATTDSKHSLPVATNLLEQHFEVEAPNQVWVSDITYIPTEEGWLYCAAHKDLWNGEIVGYALRIENYERPCREVSCPGSGGETSARRPYSSLGSGKPVLQSPFPEAPRTARHESFHEQERQLLGQRPMESFWGTIKNELIHRAFLRRRWA